METAKNILTLLLCFMTIYSGGQDGNLNAQPEAKNSLLKCAPKAARGVVVGIYDENDTPLELTVKYRGRKAANKKDRRTAQP